MCWVNEYENTRLRCETEGSVKGLLRHLWAGVRKPTILAVQMTDLPSEKMDEDVLSCIRSSWIVRSGIVVGLRGFERYRK